MVNTFQAVYENGVLRPLRKLPLRRHARVTLIVRSSKNHPVLRSSGALRVPPKLAEVIIYDPSLGE
jgi:predicted DNA-binding antitoxin AbrB/MazE fold protein